MTENNAFALDMGQTLNALVAHLGSLDECRRLGFVFKDERGVLSPSAAGMAFLVIVIARDIRDRAEAFAAGYQAAMDELS